MSGRHCAPPPPARRAVAELTALLLSVSCAGCGELDVALCPRCRWALAGPARHVRDVPGPGAAPVTGAAVPVVAVVPYAGAARRVLLGWKDDGRHDVSPLVRAGLARSVRGALALVAGPGPPSASGPPGVPGPPRAPGAEVLVVPVPSSAGASRRRGGDVLAGVTRDAVRAVAATGADVRLAPVLRQRPRVADQAGLSALARSSNLAGALVLARDVRAAHLVGRAVLVVDDVVTTGATLAEAVRVLRAAGADVGACAVVAATPLRCGRPGG